MNEFYQPPPPDTIQPKADTLPSTEAPFELIRPLEAKLAAQRKFRNPPVVLATDIHDTYWMVNRGNDPVTEERRQRFTAATVRLREKLAAESIPVIAITSIDLEELTTDPVVSPDLSTGGSPHFDAIFTAIGTELHDTVIVHPPAEGRPELVPNVAWKTKVEEEIGFKRDGVYARCLEIKNEFNTTPGWQIEFQPRDREANVQAWTEFDELTKQGQKDITPPPGKRPQPYKISYDIEVPEGVTLDQVRDRVKEMLAKKELSQNGAEESYPNIKVLTSSPDKGALVNGRQKYYIDVLPATKSDAVAFIREHYGVQVIAAGNSRNDFDALKEAGGVEVGGNPGIAGGKELTEALNNLPQLKQKDGSRFATFENPDTHNTQLLHREQGNREGPETLERAARGYKLLERLAKHL